ncbi:MAG: hypothetical protein AAF660_07540 [Pseudomonadota bacterium]
MTKRLFAIFLLVSCAATSGCAFSIHESPVNYSYSGQLVPAGDAVTRGIVVGTVEDNRTVDRPDIISHLVNGYGQTTSGGYVAEAPIGDIVKDGVQEALDAAGYSSRPELLTMNMTLEDYKYDAVSGFWNVKNITAQMTVALRMESDGVLVAQNTVIGKVKLETEELKGKPTKELIVDLFSGALDDTVTKIMEIVEIEANRT